MNIVRKALGAAAEALAEARQVRVTCSTADVDRVGDIVVQAGLDVANFRALKTVLWNHDQDCPIAKAVSVQIAGDHLEAVVEFPPEGVSELADRTYGLIKAGVINAVSIGFIPLDAVSIDGKNPKKGVRITKSELLELSFVSVPANPSAQIMERAMPTEKGAPRLTVKSLYDLGCLVSALQLVGCATLDATWEAEYEGDGSEIPGRLAEACRELGAILVDMTAEEVGEFVANVAPEAGETVEKRAPHLVVKSALETVRATREPEASEKAGRKFSSKNKSAIEAACKSILSGHDAVKALLDDDDDEDGEKAATAPATKNLDQERRRRRARAAAAA